MITCICKILLGIAKHAKYLGSLECCAHDQEILQVFDAKTQPLNPLQLIFLKKYIAFH